jgi:hypothetical protein
MARRRYTGGGWFRDDITGDPTILGSGVVSLLILVVLAGVAVGVYFIIKEFGRHEKPDEKEPEGGKVGPPISGIPGKITIAEVAHAPSAGQGIIYFSQAEASGTTCEACTAEFDVNITYSGGRPTPSPSYKKVTAPVLNGVVTFDYSVPTQTGGSTQPDVMPPTQMDVSVSARSINAESGQTGGPTTFSKTLPYVA